MTVSGQTCTQVTLVLDRFRSAAERRDWTAIAAIVDHDLKGFWLDRPLRGSGDLRAATAGPFVLADTEVSCEGTIAWVSARMPFPEGPEGRFTAVLRGTGHAWVIAQVHASLPA